MQARCLVRTLKIRTDDHKRLPGITFVIEDALRTASFPGIPPNGVVYIKCMDLGRFDPKTSSALLSRKIDVFIRNVQPVRVDSRTCDQADPSAVWFADGLEPYRLLTEKLGKGHLPRAWFWPAAVKGWSDRYPVSQNLQKIIFQVVQKLAGSAGPAVLAGLAYVLEPLYKQDVILNLFQNFDEKTTRTLISSLLPLSRPAFKNASGPDDQPTADRSEQIADIVERLDERHRHLIAAAVLRFGISDNRSILITALLLADKNTSISPGTIRQFMMRVAAREESSWHDSRAISFPEKYLPAPTIAPAFASPVDENQSERDTGRSRSPRAETDRQPGVYEHRRDNRRAEEPPQEDIPSHPSGPAGEHRLRSKIESDVKPFDEGGWSRRSDPPPEVISEKPVPRYPPLGRGDGPGPEQFRRYHPFAGALTQFAGFPMLINVLERLGIEGILADYPGYPVNDLRETVLWRIALWQKIPADDPAVLFLRDPADVFQRVDQVHIPLTRQIVFKKARPALQDLFRFPVSRDPLTPLGLKPVADIFVLAICRYIHNLGRIAIRKLIRRPAYIAITKTHLDITASMDSLDIRIRMAGLDVNPGWVPWLNRVIQIHYTEDDW